MFFLFKFIYKKKKKKKKKDPEDMLLITIWKSKYNNYS